ncbi:GCN5-like N-acetyltransferase [Listeria fleischmannii subsp. coloradonensis]|uniref:GNAT family N-acetyltransferase n=1 Tax=Listeria fleischmannii TaxID=1069827 RepID=UPI000254F1EC|nr:GNAT family N-acetyltransferase [Listeria fleischmannii]EIA19739.1 GCN5-like N-acetyltransferase [Listeria fleischmannii subsp. coloradonensis]
MNPIKFQPFPVLLTERLTLRALEDADLPALFQLKNDPKVSKYTSKTVHTSLDETQAFMDKILSGIEKNESVYWVIENKADSTFLGTICLWNMDLDEEMADVGYELLPAFWKQNYMSEALEVVMNYSYHVLRLKKLGAVTSADNIASIRLLERHHFTKNRELNDFDLTESGEKIPLIFYISKKFFFFI